MDIDELWEELLCGDAARIRRVWNDLTDEESQAVLEHLQRMRDDEGWLPEQREAATAALRAIQEQAE